VVEPEIAAVVAIAIPWRATTEVVTTNKKQQFQLRLVDPQIGAVMEIATSRGNDK
jgi:hypothetical protein